MRYFAVACDYDGTLADHDGHVTEETLGAVERLIHSGRRFVLVTGRELPDLFSVFPHCDLCDWIVAENGAVLYKPSTKKETCLAAAPTPCFVDALHASEVPVSVGRSIIATVQPYETKVLDAIRDCGLEMQLTFNKGAVMVLPSGVNKSTGLAAALEQMRLSARNVVAIGDGENDHALLGHVEARVAVANAVDTLKQEADWVTDGDRGRGVRELIDRLLADDLASLEERLARHHILLGHRSDGSEIRLGRGQTVLVAGTSGAGKSTLASAFLERLSEQGYQYCVIDPEGDYEDMEGAVALGNVDTPPTEESMTKLLERAKQNVVVNLIGVRFEDRSGLFFKLLGSLNHMRSMTGRPHFILIDEAHHVLPAAPEAWRTLTPSAFDQTGMITLEPDLIAAPALQAVDVAIAVGRSADRTLSVFAKAAGVGNPQVGPVELERGQMMVWEVRRGKRPYVMQLARGKSQLRRHGRKYAEGELSPTRSFFFRGPEAKLNLRAQNLVIFLQIAEGVDDETWLFHLRHGDYSQWFRDGIKDDKLADEAVAIEKDAALSAEDSRKRLRRLVEKHYTLPGGAGQPPAEAAEPPERAAARSE
jgi:hypothetical protein